MNSEQDEIAAVRAGQPKDFESADREATEAYHDHQDRQDAAEYDNKDSRDYAKSDQKAADELLRTFGLSDSEEVRKRAQEASESKERTEIQLGWGVSEEGVPSVRILKGVVPSNLTIDDAELLIAQFTDATNAARCMAELWKWLTENGVEGDLRNQLVLDAHKRTSEKAARDSLMGLTLGGMFQKWGSL